MSLVSKKVVRCVCTLALLFVILGDGETFRYSPDPSDNLQSNYRVMNKAEREPA